MRLWLVFFICYFRNNINYLIEITGKCLKPTSIPRRKLPIGSHQSVIKKRTTLNSNKKALPSKSTIKNNKHINIGNHIEDVNLEQESFPSRIQPIKTYVNKKKASSIDQMNKRNIENDIIDHVPPEPLDPLHIANVSAFSETLMNESNHIHCASFVSDILNNVEISDEHEEDEAEYEDYILSLQDKETQTSKDYKDPLLSYEKFSPAVLLHFTGLTPNRFEFLYKRTKAYKSPVECCLLKDQLLITLMKYKKNYEYIDLAMYFGIHRNTISRIVHIWTDILFICFHKVDFWEMRYTRDDLYTVMLDCTEIPIEKPKDANMQQVTWSNYKNTNTFKSLIGNDEAGSIIFISELFVGGISDREIVKKSGILDKLQPGDCVLADRGFVISDLLEEKNVLLNLPPFLRNKTQFTEDEVRKTRRIASRRICVENVIGQAKKAKILTDRCKSHLWPIMNKIHYNCFSIANIRNPVVTIPHRDDT